MATIDNIAWSVRPVLTPFVGFGAEQGTQLNAEVNAFQFRACNDLVLPKPPQVVRLFLTRDSTAWGSGAPSQGTAIAGYIERGLKEQLLPRTGKIYEAFKVAMPGWASTRERIMIENRVSELNPDIVISCINDINYGLNGRDILWFRAHGDEYFIICS